MRLNLAPELASRSGNVDHDEKLTNMLIEQKGQGAVVVKRPGLLEAGTAVGNGNGVVCFGGELVSVWGADIGLGVASGDISLTNTSYAAMPGTGQAHSVVTSGTIWVAAGWIYNAGNPYGCAWYSADGMTWNSTTLPQTYDSIGPLVWTGTMFAMTAQLSSTEEFFLLTSADGQTWTENLADNVEGLFQTEHALAWAGTKFLVAGDGMQLESADGATWSAVTASAVERPSYSAYLNGLLFLSGPAGFYGDTIWVSDDKGATWTAVTPTTTYVTTAVSQVVYAFGKYFAVADSSIASNPSAIISSDDGYSWLEVDTLPTTFGDGSIAYHTSSLAYNNGMLFAVNMHGAYATSTDGITWAVVADAKFYADTAPRLALTASGTGFLALNPTSRLPIVTAVSRDLAIPILSAATSAKYDFAQNVTGQLFLKTTTTAFILTETTPGNYTVTQVIDADYPAETVRGVVYLDGRFFVMTPLGEIYQSALEDGLAWDALEFIQSQSNPDKGVALAKFTNLVVALKEWSLDFYYDAANPTGSILAPVQNATQLIGLASADSLKDVAGTLIWLGHTQEGLGRAIFMLDGQVPRKLSTPAVERICTASDLSGVYSWAANVSSHLLYGITFVDLGISLVYDLGSQWWSTFTQLQAAGGPITVTAISSDGVVTAAAHGAMAGECVKIAGTSSAYDDWHVVLSVVDADTLVVNAEEAAFVGSATLQRYTESIFPISSSTRCSGHQYMQHATSGILYELAQTAYTDDVVAIAANVRTAKYDAEDVAYRTMNEVELVGDKVSGMAAIRWSDDDYQTFSAGRSLNLAAERSRARRFGRFSRRAFEIIAVGDTLLRLEALEISVK